jgi:uncharacterized protein
MTTATFADSSAVVKLYADERGAEVVRSAQVLVISQLARVEVPAAFWKKQRVGELSPAFAAVLVAEFEADYFGTEEDPPRFAIVAATDAILEDATRLVAVHGLRAYDAVQLASALAARAASEANLAFLAFDGALCTAAAAEGFEIPAL